MKQMRQWMMAAILVCGATTVNAQDTKHEIGISYGTGCNSTLLSYLEDLVGIAATAGGVTYGDSKEFGTLGLEYFYHVNDKIGIGAVLGYAEKKNDILINSRKDGEAKNTYYTIMPAAKLDWFQKQHVGMYSKIALGLTVRNQKQEYSGNDNYNDSDVLFNWQLSLFGLEAGSQNIRAFAELGFGEQGIALVGVRCKF